MHRFWIQEKIDIAGNFLLLSKSLVSNGVTGMICLAIFSFSSYAFEKGKLSPIFMQLQQSFENKVLKTKLATI